MNRLNRLTAILTHLQSKRVITAQEIANRFEISLRTVYRDIRALQEAGIPIGAEVGKGYSIVKGYHLPPVMFSKEEASALLLGEKLIQEQSDDSIKKHFGEAMLKIKAVLRYTEKDFIEDLEGQIEVLHTKNVLSPKFPNHFLSDIQNALASKRVLKFDYYSNYNDQFTSRAVEPSGLCYYSGHWHLIAYCRLRKDVRDFRVGRIMKLIVLEEVFENAHKENFKAFVQQLISGSDLEKVEVEVDQSVVRYLGDQKYYQGFIKEVALDNSIKMTFMTPNLEYFARWLLMFGKEIIIISPKRLTSIAKGLVKELGDHYKPEFD